MSVTLHVDEWIDGLATEAEAGGLHLVLERHQTAGVRLQDRHGRLSSGLGRCLLGLARHAPQQHATLSLMVLPSAVHPTRRHLTGLLLSTQAAAGWEAQATTTASELRALGCDDVLTVHNPDKGSCLSFSIGLDDVDLLASLPPGLREDPHTAADASAESAAANANANATGTNTDTDTHASPPPETLPPLPVPLRVLAVDDDALSLRIIRLALREVPCVLEEVTDGLSALEKLLGRPADELPHVVLMDIQMPHLDGLQTARAIKGRPEWTHIPIVAVSGHTQAQHVSEAMDAGMGDLVAKPVAHSSLLRAIRRQIAATLPA